jgi:acyl-CoA synthetase (AMP-forming)/AMP-acid ligase II
LSTNLIWARTYDDVLGTPMTTAESLINLVAIPICGVLLMLAPVAVVRLWRPGVRESLDGFVFGALAALCFTSAEILTRAAPDLATGDRVRRFGSGPPAGYVEVTGRVKDVIHRGGETVSALDLEAHLLTHPSIWSAAAVPLPDQYLGEKICATVVFTGKPVSMSELKTTGGWQRTPAPTCWSPCRRCPPPRSARSTRRR